MKPEIITLMGATASGKTAIAMQLANHYPIDIISVDSALIYKGMDIGTAKPTVDELKQYPHKLIDLIEPNERYSVADFRTDALDTISQSLKNNRIPLLVGGTMLYFKGLLEGLSPLPSSNEQIREQINHEVESIGWQGIHKKLKTIDPESAARIHATDSQRLNRSYEIYLLSGKSMTELQKEKGQTIPYKVHEFAIEFEDRTTLHQRIEQRFMQMLALGFEQEVIKLMARGDLSPELPSMRCVGYRQMWDYLNEKISYDEMAFQGICATRQLAKRQITWLRGWKSPLTLINSSNIDGIKQRLDAMMNNMFKH